MWWLSPELWGIVGGAAGFLIVLWRAVVFGRNMEKGKQAEREKDAFNEYLDRVEAANTARDNVGPDGVRADPHNRDNRG